MERTCFESDIVSSRKFDSCAVWDGDHTSSGWVVSGHLSEVGVVLYCRQNRVSHHPTAFLTRQPIPLPSNVCSRWDRLYRHTLRTEELSGDVQGLASHNDDLLAIEQLLSNSARQPTEEMTLAIDRDLCHTVESASVPQIVPILGSESFLFKLTVARCEAGRETYGWLEGRHFCPASR